MLGDINHLCVDITRVCWVGKSRVQRRNKEQGVERKQSRTFRGKRSGWEVKQKSNFNSNIEKQLLSTDEERKAEMIFF